MSGKNRTKRTSTSILVLGVICLLLMFLALRTFEGYADRVDGAGAGDAADSDGAAAPGDDAAGSEDSGVSPEDDPGPRVVFADGTPAAGAVIESTGPATGVPAAPVTTDADGRFPAADPPGVEQRVRLGPLTVTGTDLPDEIQLPATFELAGVVLARDGRTGVAAATIACAGAETVTDADGAFRLPGVPGVVFREAVVLLQVRADGFRPLDVELPRDEFPGYYGDLLLRLER